MGQLVVTWIQFPRKLTVIIPIYFNFMTVMSFIIKVLYNKGPLVTIGFTVCITETVYNRKFPFGSSLKKKKNYNWFMTTVN